jgi:hypothetical protein
MLGLDRVVKSSRVRLWSRYGPLSRESDQCSMSELGLGLDPNEPLDVFVQVQGPPQGANLGQVGENFNPKDSWGLDTSVRGLSTFVCSLKVLLQEIDRSNITVEAVLDALLRITRFPPALLAFTHLHAAGLGPYTEAHHLHLLIDVFHALCKTMVPEWICNSDTAVLEGSRQVLAWLHNLSAAAAKDGTPPAPCHVFRVQVSAEGTPEARSHVLRDSSTIQLPDGQSYRVSLETTVSGGARGLALAGALHHATAQPWHYFTSPSPGWLHFMEAAPLKRPDLGDFEDLLRAANESRAFRLVDPMTLGTCFSADLPVLTMNGKGYVSTYEQVHGTDCGEPGYYYLWNCITKMTICGPHNPGQLISVLEFTYARARLDPDPYISTRLQWYPVFLPSLFSTRFIQFASLRNDRLDELILYAL